MNGEVYRIVDEPQPGRLADYAVAPGAPLLGMMLAGSWFGLPWFFFNGLAMRSPNRRREIATMIGLTALAIAIAAGAELIFGRTGPHWRYVFLGIRTAKVAGGYWLTQLQEQPYALHVKTVGRSRSGISLALAAYFARDFVVPAAFELSPWLGIVVL